MLIRAYKLQIRLLGGLSHTVVDGAILLIYLSGSEAVSENMSCTVDE